MKIMFGYKPWRYVAMRRNSKKIQIEETRKTAYQVEMAAKCTSGHSDK
jgi:hypothetical protein